MRNKTQAIAKTRKRSKGFFNKLEDMFNINSNIFLIILNIKFIILFYYYLVSNVLNSIYLLTHTIKLS